MATRRHTYLGSFFLDREDVKILGPLWNFFLKDQGSIDLDISLRGTKGLSKTPTCIGIERDGTHLLFCYVRADAIWNLGRALLLFVSKLSSFHHE